MSLSGAQFKLLLYVDEDGNPARPMGNAPSTHILKPDIQRSDIKVFASSVNETIIMLAADKCGLQTAKVAYQSNTRACLVERYDRERQPDGSLKRIWQADFCQMLAKPSDVKYEAEGGPTFKDCYDLLGASALPAVDRLQLLRWLFFNLCAGNDDSHAKNLSIIATPKGLRLAPFYDMMCTRVYPGLAAKFAFEIAGETEPGKITGAYVRDCFIFICLRESGLRASELIGAKMDAVGLLYNPNSGNTYWAMTVKAETAKGGKQRTVELVPTIR